MRFETTFKKSISSLKYFYNELVLAIDVNLNYNLDLRSAKCELKRFLEFCAFAAK